MASETKLDPRDRLAVMVSMAGSYIESGRGDDALAVMRTVAEDVATEIARLTRELEEARERERALRVALVQAAAYMPQHRAVRAPLMQCTACDRLRGPNVGLCLECARAAIDRALSTPEEPSGV